MKKIVHGFKGPVDAFIRVLDFDKLVDSCCRYELKSVLAEEGEEDGRVGR